MASQTDRMTRFKRMKNIDMMKNDFKEDSENIKIEKQKTKKGFELY